MVGSWVVNYGGNTRFGWTVGVGVYGLLQYLRGGVVGDGAHGSCDDEVGLDGGVVGWGVLSGLESKIGGFYLRVRELVCDDGGNRWE